MSPFVKCFSFTRKRKAAVFKFLRFEERSWKARIRDGLVWTVRLTVDSKLRFQISAAWCGRCLTLSIQPIDLVKNLPESLFSVHNTHLSCWQVSSYISLQQVCLAFHPMVQTQLNHSLLSSALKKSNFGKSWWLHGSCCRLRIKRSGFEAGKGTLRCVLGQDTLLSQCLSPPRCINGYRRT